MGTFIDDRVASRIKHWDFRHVRSLFVFIRNEWIHHRDGGWIGTPETERGIKLNTLHNGINTELIAALQLNRSIWEMVWRRSERVDRGVLHHFEIPEWIAPIVPRTAPEATAELSQGGFLTRIDNRMLRFLGMVADQGADAIASRVCGDLLPEADALWSDEENQWIAELVEQWNSKGKDEAMWSGQAWIYLRWFADHLLLWADSGKALEPVEETKPQ
jgi:hypothetical protein